MFRITSSDRVSPVVAVVLMVAVTVVLAAVIGPYMVGIGAAEYTSDDTTATPWLVDSDSELTDTKDGDNSSVTATDGIATVEGTGWALYDISTEDLEAADTLTLHVTSYTAGNGATFLIQSDGTTGPIDYAEINGTGDVTLDVSSIDVNSSDDYEVNVDVMDNTTVSFDYLALTGPNSAPTAAMSFSPSSPVEGDTVSFDAGSSSDPEAHQLTYSWDFDGDGTEDATGMTPDHVYETAGTYSATVTVTDEHGATDTSTADVTVDSPPTYDVTFNVTDGDGNASANASVNVTQNDTEVATATSDENGSATVSLADGDYSYTVAGPDGNLSASGTFTVNGSATTVDATVTEDTGGTCVVGPMPDDQQTVIAVILLLAGGVLVALKLRD